jgi:hypothetical protein
VSEPDRPPRVDGAIQQRHTGSSMQQMMIPTVVPPAPVATAVTVDVSGSGVIARIQDPTGIKIVFLQAEQADGLSTMLHNAAVRARLGLIVPGVG